MVVFVILIIGLFVTVAWAAVRRVENVLTFAGYPPVSTTDALYGTIDEIVLAYSVEKWLNQVRVVAAAPIVLVRVLQEGVGIVNDPAVN